MSATDILGKIGEKVGSEFSDLRVSISSTYATKVSLNTIDLSPYATVVSLGSVASDVSTNSSDITVLQNASASYASKVSLGVVKTNLESSIATKSSQVSIANILNGTTVFSDLSATRAEIGDLTVTGTTTTLNTQTLNVEDNIIEVNLQSDGSETAQTGGIEINRGGGTQATVTETYLTGYSNLQVTKDSSNNVTDVSWDYGGSTITYSVPSGHTSFPFNYHLGNMADPSDYSDGAGSNFNFGGTFGSDGQGGSTNTSPLQYIEQVVLSGQGGVNRFVTFTHSSGTAVNDKAKFIWDDNGQGSFKALLGTTATTLEVGVLKVPDSAGIKINNVDLGDYSTFETAFLAEL